MPYQGESRGGHYHNRAIEWFTLVEGNAVLKLEDIRTNEKKEIYLNDQEPVTVFVPPHIAHEFINIDSVPFIVIAYTDQLYKPEDTIQYILK
ncbi:WxcM-like domain-containing protein [Bacteroides fragilis]|nr:WxcM-like domain-containing protein [Bacteroides fragilis]